MLISADGLISDDLYPGSSLNGGFTILELPTRDDAVRWAAKIARACRCSQECAVRVRPGKLSIANGSFRTHWCL